MFQLSDYGYDLPTDQIAQIPCDNRSDARLLCLNRQTHQTSHHQFKDICSLLRPDDLLVINNTRVVPARLFGHKESGGKIEILIIDYVAGVKHLEQTGFFQCDCLIKASKQPKPGTKLILAHGVQARVVAVKDNMVEICFLNGPDFLSFLNESGQLPLPPYIKRDDTHTGINDPEDYQTVYARTKGAVAAPTAGLHFTQSLMADLEQKGIEFAPITLHVGYGTFVPVRVDDIRDHKIHSESFSMSKESADKINLAKSQHRRIVAVGTTSVRTLEYLADPDGRVKALDGVCNLFIYPGYTFKCVDAMITNFHLPESTLLMLVSAFYTRKRMLAAYQEAIDTGYRFFSYGDAMLIE
ncbi:MAG: tRNA preQ1(34) S-adenosylmethionine ribosyltransferase-isomerase QueA [Pseudomonadota bacterium]